LVPDLDPLARGTDPGIRIPTKMSRIPNSGQKFIYRIQIRNIIFRFFWFLIINVADAGCLSRISDPNFFISDPGSRVKNIPDPISGSASKNFSPKKLFLSSQKYDPDLDFLTNPDPGSRGSKRHCIPDPDPQHCLI
jgi:hypothetical protein